MRSGSNVFFNNFDSFAEQDLLESLIVESISIYGHNISYCPRTIVDKDDIYGEDPISEYNSAYTIDMYIRSFDSYDGAGAQMRTINNNPDVANASWNGSTTNYRDGTAADDSEWQDQVKKDLFVRIYTDNTTPYVGEQVNVYLKLYQNINTSGLGVSEIPDFEGFWKHDYELKNQEYKKEQLDGKWYNIPFTM